jgi:hypothetical protein
MSLLGNEAPMISLARNHMTCFLCCQLHDRCYAIISACVSTIEAEFSLSGVCGGYITSCK